MSDHVPAVPDLVGSRTLSGDDLAVELGGSPLEAPEDARLVLGDAGTSLLGQMIGVVERQWGDDTARGLVRGFCLGGPPGTGKTTLAKLLGYELARRSACRGGDPVVTVLVDGADIAASRYGESEQRIRTLFREVVERAHEGNGCSVLLLDDLDTFFLGRQDERAKEWNVSQSGVLCHALDELDTRVGIVLVTTNRPEVLDAAIRDRLVDLDLGRPSDQLLADVARRSVARRGLAQDAVEEVVARVRDAIGEGRVRTFRDVEGFTALQCVACEPGTERAR